MGEADLTEYDSFRRKWKRPTKIQRILMASLRIGRDFVKAFSKIAPSASNVFWAGEESARFPTWKESSGGAAMRSTHVIGFARTHMDALKRGLVPNWAKDPKIAYKTINASGRRPSILAAPVPKKACGLFAFGPFQETSRRFRPPDFRRID
jgi:hypothetical protein